MVLPRQFLELFGVFHGHHEFVGGHLVCFVGCKFAIQHRPIAPIFDQTRHSRGPSDVHRHGGGCLLLFAVLVHWALFYDVVVGEFHRHVEPFVAPARDDCVVGLYGENAHRRTSVATPHPTMVDDSADCVFNLVRNSGPRMGLVPVPILAAVVDYVPPRHHYHVGVLRGRRRNHLVAAQQKIQT